MIFNVKSNCVVAELELDVDEETLMYVFSQFDSEMLARILLKMKTLGDGTIFNIRGKSVSLDMHMTLKNFVHVSLNRLRLKFQSKFRLREK